MKKALFLLAACTFATASFAQTTPHTEVNVRDNGTKKITTTHRDGSTTVTKTGKTNVGAALDNTGDAIGNVAETGVDKAGNLIDKGAHSVKKGYKTTKHATKRTATKASGGLKKETKQLENKTE